MNKKNLELLYIRCMAIINVIIYFALTVLACGLGLWFVSLIGFLFIVGICAYSNEQIKKLRRI